MFLLCILAITILTSVENRRFFFVRHLYLTQPSWLSPLWVGGGIQREKTVVMG